MRIPAIALAVALVFLGPDPSAAQSGGLIVLVKGPTGPLNGVDVEVVYPGILLVRGETDKNGTAQIRPIPTGTCNVPIRCRWPSGHGAPCELPARPEGGGGEPIVAAPTE